MGTVSNRRSGWRAELVVKGPKVKGRRYVIRTAQKFLVGRNKEAAILVPDPRASRRHLTLELRPTGLFATDLSKYGTFLAGPTDGAKVKLVSKAPTRVSTGQSLVVGKHRIHVELTRLRSRPDEDAKSGESLFPDEFELLGEVGSGGAGRVYAAQHKLLGRTVAIKTLRDDRDLTDEDRERFIREASICCRVKSPYVVELYDVRTFGGRLCMVMEFVNGPSAWDRLKNGPLALVEAVEIGEHIAQALVAASSLDIVHRDVKPHNILINHDGIAKLSDFGLAKDLLSSGHLTTAGMTMGTIAYAPPEQLADATNVTQAADIYALGGTLYHLLTGEPPYPLCRTTSDILRVLRQKEDGDPPAPIGSLREGLPMTLGTLVHRMLDPNPERRPSAGAVAADLGALRRGVGAEDDLSMSGTSVDLEVPLV